MKMSRKWLLVAALVLSVAMASTGTIAYLQDSDSDVNVMTMGSVHIKQHEYERVVENGEYKTATIDDKTSYVLKDFTQGKPIVPIVGDPSLPGDNPGYAGYDTTPVRMSQVDSYGGMDVFAGKNAQDKFVTVENTGKSPAYVRTLVAIEIGSTDGGKIGCSYHQTWTKNTIGAIVIDGNNYALTEYLYNGAAGVRHENGILPAGDTTYPNLSQVYLKSSATNEDLEAIDGNGNGMLDILVVSQAVQADGFDNAKTALDTAFGEVSATSHPWMDGEEGDQEPDDVEIPTVVTTLDDFKAAIEEGKTNIVVKGVTIAESVNTKSHQNVDYVDCTFNANLSWKYINNVTYTNCTFNPGTDQVAVHYDQMYGKAVFNDCNFITGKVQMGAASAENTFTFNNCKFGQTTSTSIWAEKGMRFYGPTEFNNCEFNNRVVVAGSNGLPITFNSCTMNGGTPVYYVDNTDGIIRGGNIPAVTIK